MLCLTFCAIIVLLSSLSARNINAELEEKWNFIEDYAHTENIAEENNTINTDLNAIHHNNSEPLSQLNIYQLKRLDDTLNSLMLESWKRFCDATLTFISGSNFTAHWTVLISCDLKGSHAWSLQSYRAWVLDNERALKQLLQHVMELRVAVKLRCNGQSSVSIPWPAKAKYLWYLSIDKCTILNHIQEYNQNEPYEDFLKVYEVTDSIQETNVHVFLDALINYRNRSRQFDCGGTELEKYVFRNVSKTFTGITEMMEKAPSETEVMDTFATVGQINQKSNYACNFKQLRYIDESMSIIVSKHRWHFLTEHGELPSLEYYNLSHSRIREMSIHFLEWRRYFPKLKYLDLSFNKIKYFSGISDNGLSTDPIGVIDLRRNNITSLSKDDIYTLKFQSQTVFIDIRNNPIKCDCKLSPLVNTLKNSSSVLLKKYNYMSELKCAQPASLSGKIISKLDNEHCEFIEVFSLVVPVVILSCCLVFLALVMLITIKYRQEIMILAFTRLHISLPCREVVNVNKAYDAFICYSEHDLHWVIYTLLPRLEEPDNGPGFKLCIHHRDFPVGGAIFDNIDSKVRESRHTVLILSNHFLRSTWCKCEFWAAFTESLTQKKRHLIMIILEDLDDALMEPTLKRCLKTFTYVRLDDRLFWDKIIYALSDKRDKIKNKGVNDELIIVPNLKGDEMNNIEHGNAINIVLDGVNNNRDVVEVIRNNLERHVDINDERIIGENDNIIDGRHNYYVNLKNVRHVKQAENPQLLHLNDGPKQDGEWIL